MTDRALQKTNGQKTAIQDMAERLKVSPDILAKTLKSTVIKGPNGREATNEEFVACIAVANQYRLNPITKEMFAFPDKQGGVIPIVSTDGWNKLMTTHPNYKSHHYKMSENTITITDHAKPCPEWMEIHIEKKDGGEVVVREYLDECYNGNKTTKDGKYYPSPWDTHTKRMLRHKTKIQGAREAFGFGGIYDEDEAERIQQAETARPDDYQAPIQPTLSIEEMQEEEEIKGDEPITAAPDTDPGEKPQEEIAEDLELETALNQIKEAQDMLGDESFYEVLVKHDVALVDHIKTIGKATAILHDLNRQLDKMMAEKDGGKSGQLPPTQKGVKK